MGKHTLDIKEIRPSATVSTIDLARHLKMLLFQCWRGEKGVDYFMMLKRMNQVALHGSRYCFESPGIYNFAFCKYC